MIIPKSGKFCCRCQEREYVKPVSRAGKLVSVILNPVTLLDLHSFRPVVYKDVFFSVLCCTSPLELQIKNNNNRNIAKNCILGQLHFTLLLFFLIRPLKWRNFKIAYI